MSEKNNQNLQKCISKEKTGEYLYRNIDFSTASIEIMREYNISDRKRRQLMEFLQLKVKNTKIKEYKQEIKPEYPRIVQQDESHRKLLTEADKLPTTIMSLDMYRAIMKSINNNFLENAWPETVKVVMEDIKREYFEVSHTIGVNSRIRPLDGSDPHIRLRPYVFLGKTQQYLTFLWLRKEIKLNLFLPYPLLRRLHYRCVCDIPELLVDIGVFRDVAYETSELSAIIKERIRDCETEMAAFYKDMIDISSGEQYKADIPKRKEWNYWSTATTLLEIHIIRILRNTIGHVVMMSGDVDRIPYLKLFLKYNRGLTLYPNAEATTSMYFDLIDTIAAVCRGLSTFQSHFIKGAPDAYISTFLPKNYILDCKRKIAENISKMYKNIDVYVLKVENKFSSAIMDSTGSMGETEISFEEGCEKIDFYIQFIGKISDMVSDEFYAIGELEQEECKSNLKAAVFDLIDDIASKLVLQQQWENEDICETFEMLVVRATKEPETSEELVELGKYMTWANTELMTQLTERIQLSLVVISRLMDLTNITDEHMQLNSITVNWLKNIKPILEFNSSMFEQKKFEFEERLQRAIEKLNKNINDLTPYLVVLDNMDNSDRAREYVHQLSSMLIKIRECDDLQQWINKEELTFKFPISAFKDLEELKKYIYPFYRLVRVCMLWKRNYDVWMDGRFEFLDFPTAEEKVDEIYKELMKTQKLYRNKLRQLAADNDPRRFMGSVDDPDPLNLPAPIKLITNVTKQIKEFRPILTLMGIMCNKALLQRHWDEMSEIAGFDLTPNAGTTLRKLANMGLEKNIDSYDVISGGAVKELMLITSLEKMQAEWGDIRFKTSPYKETGIAILTSLDDVQAVLDDHIVKTLSMRGSIFVKPYEEQVVAWYDKIVRINNTIELWGKVQAQWLYLLPIFSSKDIISQMPTEGILFRDVDGIYKRYMTAVHKDSRVIETAAAPGLLEAMEGCLDMLEKINDGVTEYLEKKRLYFPRFFFLSNDEMLEILSETKDPLRVQPHLRKCFEAINTLQFDERLQIHAMFSQENEKIAFLRMISTEEAGGSVEKWLIQVEEQMVLSVRNQILVSWRDYKDSLRVKWVQKWPGQVVLAVSQIFWTADVQSTLNLITESDEMEEFYGKLVSDLKKIVNLVRDTDLTNLTRITIKALIVIDVHAKDVVQEMMIHDVTNSNEFKWLAQLRYYWEDDDCLVRITNATVSYAYEYLGNSDRLVITPLTDRCYRTLVGAYHLHLNGAPEGPAGTGKTETTKDLAKALAVQCVVFNCSDGLDYKAMGKFFKGLASSGAWACFDEFNRIEIEVLSVVAQQILCIVMAVRANVKKFLFEGTELILNPHCYVCITMNPGYAGRTELPDNLKVLFRTVAMMVPDYAMIGEISLYSYGFIDARKLSVKIVTVYRLCSEQLSSQNHYDYGMRAVKSVLSAAGNIKRLFPDEDEDILLLRSITDVNLPKFLNHDIPLFEGIISDLFPGISLPISDYKHFTVAMKKSMLERNLQPRDSFVLKIIQTYEMMIVRHGFMLVGEPFAGKSVTLKVLADALTTLHEQGRPEEKVQYQIMNPKAVTMGQLYGQFDPISYEWTDGVVATCFRRFVTDPSPDRKWVIFDGPVDAVWIENMNTVLDDNKKLCLMSGEVMAMTAGMSMIFEVMDLTQASPATVSRCGMIYMEPATLGWQPFVESWIVNVNSEYNNELYHDVILSLIHWIVPPCLFFIRKQCKQLCVVGEISLVKGFYQIFELSLDEACNESANKENDFKFLFGWIQAALIYATVWGLGGILDGDSREKFDEFAKNLFRGLDPENPYPDDMEKLEISIPTDGLLMDYIYVFKLKGSWKYWPEVVRTMRVEEATNIQQALIPTVETIKYMTIAEMHIKRHKPILWTGPTGTGKSFYLQDLLMNKLDPEVFEPAFITFTVNISANQTQDLVISKLFKRKRGNYGPSKGKTCVMFVDDLNMPAKEVYGAQPPIELLRQYFDHKNWYDLKDTSPIFLHDTLFVAAMGTVGGSRQEVYMRFLRHFTVFSINEFSDETMSKIYANILLLAYKKNGFPSDIVNTVHQIVAGSLDIYKSAMAQLRPTPAKSHYVFNLRDFSRVIFGCGMLRKDSVDKDNKKIFARLWIHECLRIFYDRLVDDKDKSWLYEKLRMSVREHFREHFDNIFDNLKADEDGKIPENSLKQLMFGTFLDTDASEEDIKYEEIENKQQFIDVAVNCLDEYNSTHKNKMDIILFEYALEHLCKICRILSQAQGCALLVGISGSGRQSLTKLATTICGHSFFQPEITNNYNLNEWREDLKRVLKESGGKGKHTTFLFTESQIKEESFLQDIDGLLNSGEVPNIFPIDERQEVLEMVRLAAQGGQRNLDISSLAVFSYFIKRCKERLHIVLCFSPIGSMFRSRLRLYPSLVNCCTIDWFEDWPEDALERVAHNWISDINAPEDIKIKSVIACKHFHMVARMLSESFFKETCRKTYVTSASYLELIKSFTEFTNRRQKEIMNNKNQYVAGLEKLAHAASAVAEMQRNLEEYHPLILEMAAKATEMTKQIEKETAEVEVASNLVRQDEKIANVQAAEAQALKSECEADLALAIPILEEAIEALNTLKPTDITLVKSMKNPPDAVKLVMAAVCVIKDIKPDRLNDASTGRKILDYWGPSKRLLGEMNFLQLLKDFDKDHIKPEVMVKIRKEYLPNKIFKPHIVAKASSAAEGLCKWIIAMDLYDAVAKEVAPKKAKLEIAEQEYSATMKILNEKKEMVAKLEARLANLNEMLADAMRKQHELEETVNLCADKLRRAEKLLGGLGGERSRWIAATNALQTQYDSLTGDILLSCGVISYLSSFTAHFRNEAISGWQELVKTLQIPCSNNYDFTTILGSDIKIQNWYISGLPRDSFSTENAIIQDCTRRWSLLVDPQNQANLWIKKMERRNEIVVTKFTDRNYMKVLERAIHFGRPALIEGIAEDLVAPLDPILFKCIFQQAGVNVIALGDNIIPYNSAFKLYLTTKLRNPHYLPEVFNKVTIVNFALTVDGLQDQLLGIVVAKERPDLQRQREDLIIRSAANQAALKKVEEDILKTLSESQGDILEDETAIEILDQSKIISTDIIRKQTVAKETEKKIEGFRQDYKPIAEHSAVLYYCIADLPNVDPMYQYSLGWFINLYISSIESANKSRDLKKRLQFLKEAFTYNLYTNVCRSLFEKDKLMFSFILCTTILAYQKKLDENELNFLLTGGINVDNPIPNPATSWLSDKSWNEICRVDNIVALAGFKYSFEKNIDKWKHIYDMAEPQVAVLPGEWQAKLTSFQKLVVIRLLRQDKLKISISRFVENEMGAKFILPPPFDISKSFEESSCLCPLLFILSPGTDPMAALTKFAELKGFADKFQSISLGQGQGPIAAALIERAQQEGGWVCLQNCHLAVSWMNALEAIWENMDPSNTDSEFRLWLTSYPSDKFPVSILQYGVKMTNEPPEGLQQNLLRSYINEPVKNSDFYTGCPGKESMFARLLYGIAFFHAVVQERRNFGPLGWNIPYGFNESDFDISVQQLRMYINENENPFEAVTYLTGECNYGGRVTDDWDRRLIVTLLADFVNPQVVSDLTYSFSSAGTCYAMPRKFDYQDYLDHITNLPQIHPPEVCGLHSNAGITRDLQVTNLLLDSMIAVRGEGGAGGGTEVDKIILMISQDVLVKLPKPFDLEKAKEKYPVRYNESMNTVLVQEMERFNKLLNEINSSLANIQKAVNGLVIMSPALELLSNSLMLGRIPASWAKVSYPSLKSLPNYVADFVDRLTFLYNWYEHGKPVTFWISGFFFTQAFLTGAKQNFARKYTIPIDQLTFDFSVLKVDTMSKPPSDGIYVYGLYTDGARWHRSQGVLDELYPKILYDSMPLIWLIPILLSDFQEDGRYSCPLYKTSERRGILSTTGHSTNYVLPFMLNSRQPASHWIKRSVALLCQLDY